ncbi:MAG: Vacuolar protein-sorting-associated protein 28 [Trichoglossum hirsutum]|nr:MAG: Vacuolar protein-sorting-associated protein 28 [Trichoglossum hirsutum]
MYASVRQPPYAPTPYNYPPNPSLSSRINLDEEVRLSTSSAQRDLYDSLAEIYSVIVTLDALEKAYIKDSITEAEYTETCDRLLKQFKAILSDETVSREFVNLETFKREWDMECPRATERLRIGLPATVEQPTPSNTGVTGAAIAEATQDFITFLDALKLNLLAKDSLHPLLSDVIQSVNKVTDRDFEGRGKIVQWLITLNQMKATEEVTEDQARELSFDMEQAYHGFKSTLK